MFMSPQCFLLRKTPMWTTSSHQTHLPFRPTIPPSYHLLCPLSLVTWCPGSHPCQTSPHQRRDPLILCRRCLAVARRGSALENQSAAATLLKRMMMKMRMRMRRSSKRARKMSKRWRMRWRGASEAGCIYRKASHRRWICWVRKGFERVEY